MATIKYKYYVSIPIPAGNNGVYAQAQLDDGTYLNNDYKSELVEGSEVCKDEEVKKRVETLTRIDGGKKYTNIEVIF